MISPDFFNIVLLGAPGSGKGTQAQLMKQNYNLEHISTGDLYRNEMAAETPIGLKAKHIIERGDLCPDDMTLDMLYQFCSNFPNVRGFILDGVPRTLEQALMMEGIGYPNIIPVNLAIFINVDKNEVADRLAQRALLLNRIDDTPEVIRQRILNYETQTKKLLEYYQVQNKLVEINGMQTIEKVFFDISEILNSY